MLAFREIGCRFLGQFTLSTLVCYYYYWFIGLLKKKHFKSHSKTLICFWITNITITMLKNIDNCKRHKCHKRPTIKTRNTKKTIIINIGYNKNYNKVLPRCYQVIWVYNPTLTFYIICLDTGNKLAWSGKDCVWPLK